MTDLRFQKLADVLVTHSTRLESGDAVLIEAFDIPDEMVIQLVRRVRAAGGRPLVSIRRQRVMRELIAKADDAGMELIGEVEKHRMQQVQAYIGIRGSHNIAEMSDVDRDALERYESHWLKPVHFNLRVPKTRWVVLRWPTPSMAQQAGMSTEAFETFYFDVCTLDYAQMAEALEYLKARMERTDQVHIQGPGTDLSFRIGGIPSVPCSGERNIPDGECFTAPIKDSVNGTISFNTPTLYHGTSFQDIRLRFESGRVVEATSNRTERLNEILDTDEGARYVGEFSLGVNPRIRAPMMDILFDEKIAGSFHFTPGQAYEEADNGNRSAVHWDMVMRQDESAGGGEIRFDDELIRKDGRFMVDDLKRLNPEELA